MYFQTTLQHTAHRFKNRNATQQSHIISSNILYNQTFDMLYLIWKEWSKAFMKWLSFFIHTHLNLDFYRIYCNLYILFFSFDRCLLGKRYTVFFTHLQANKGNERRNKWEIRPKSGTCEAHFLFHGLSLWMFLTLSLMFPGIPSLISSCWNWQIVNH